MTRLASRLHDVDDECVLSVRLGALLPLHVDLGHVVQGSLAPCG
ncbi:MAG: hypothetical protein ACRDH6_04450 [Actinomycetota bacterium]